MNEELQKKVDRAIRLIQSVKCDCIEVWKDIVGYEGQFMISNMGNARSLDRIVNHGRNGKMKVSGKELSHHIRNDGYISICLGHGNKKLLHRIMAEAFLSNPENKRTVNHIDGNPSNNIISNLEWATDSEQQKHAIKYLGKKVFIPSLGKFGKDHHLAKRISKYSIDGELIEHYGGLREAARQNNLQASNISACCLGKINSCGGYKWKYE